MMKLPADMKIIGGAALIGLAALWWITRPGNASGAGQAVGGAAVDLLGGIGTGAVSSAGDLLGIPATSRTQCEQDLAAGRTWDASFSCPAGTWLKNVFGG